ncbi:AraC family transcriptional regulator [Sodalis ligni]|uniref:AraC family transcriptional regulator n=1 Tax=Sodalis ligni TaxID=2697027 RepID=A0A4R1NIT3_9GAMM|nr:helix-turn-helix transcriptional regulator [Sodalis ligni]TCL06999.1 AraC family transcriptional regulator [Sodalis ligni]
MNRKYQLTRRMTLPPEHPGERRDTHAVAAMAKDYSDNAVIDGHAHRRSQLVFASTGVMTVTTDRGTWVVPPQRALWMPAGIEHEIRASGILRMRTLYFEPETEIERAFPPECSVMEVTPLMRELILRAASLEIGEQVQQARLERLVAVLLDEAQSLSVLSLHLPIPDDPRLARICADLIADPSIDLTLAEWGRTVGASARTLTRQFLAGTGMTFTQWRQRARILASLPRLARGESIISVALGLGYDSPSAFGAMFKRTLGATPAAYFNSRYESAGLVK